jgi:hypothetical protein
MGTNADVVGCVVVVCGGVVTGRVGAFVVVGTVVGVCLVVDAVVAAGSCAVVGRTAAVGAGTPGVVVMAAVTLWGSGSLAIPGSVAHTPTLKRQDTRMAQNFLDRINILPPIWLLSAMHEV